MKFVHPTPIQASTIPIALLGRDVCGCAATGTGKTAAFMLPVMERLLYRPKAAAITRVLVLVPTRELGVQVMLVFSSSHSVSNDLTFTFFIRCIKSPNSSPNLPTFKLAYL